MLCRVSGGSARAGFSVIVQPNGTDDSSGAYSATLYLPDVALDADFPSGTWIIGHKAFLKSTGGSET